MTPGIEWQVSNLELSKKLRELGVRQESLFYWLTFRFHEPSLVFFDDIKQDSFIEEFSAFTVAELGLILGRNINCVQWNDYLKKWRIYLDIGTEVFVDTEADARAYLVAHLIGQGVIIP